MIRNEVQKLPVVHTINKEFQASIHNRFDIEVRDAKTGKLKQRAQAFNVICENLWKRFGFVGDYSGLQSSWFNSIVYGDGEGAPASTDTKLFGTAHAVTLSDAEVVVDTEHGVCWRTRKAKINETVSQFFTIREIGLGSTSAIYTHAMLQDMNGNPISIYKTDTDIITFYATVFAHWDPSGYGKVHIPGSPVNSSTSSIPHTFLSAALGLGLSFAFSGMNSSKGKVCIGRGTAQPAQVIYCDWSGQPQIAWAWDYATKTFTVKMPRLGASVGNIGGFGWYEVVSTSGDNGASDSDTEFVAIDVRDRYEVVGEAVGTGDGTKTEFATKFDLPVDATILVDGVAVPNVSVLEIPAAANANAYNYFVRIEKFLYNGKTVCRYNNNSGLHVYYYRPQGRYYNPLWEVGIQSFSGSIGYQLSFSDDFVSWSEPVSAGTIPEAYRHCKYIDILFPSSLPSNASKYRSINIQFAKAGNNIVFSEPPAQGSVITANYVTPFVPKDENNVYDMTFTVQYGEYSAEGV